MSPTTDAPTIAPDRQLEEDKKPGDSEPPRIRCPLCGWSPRKEDKWFCTCGYDWNTFDTGGVCPACLHQWTETQCLSCSRWSPYSDWYANCPAASYDLLLRRASTAASTLSKGWSGLGAGCNFPSRSIRKIAGYRAMSRYKLGTCPWIVRSG
jgi:hypothetical protein